MAESESNELTIEQVLRHYAKGRIRIPGGSGWKPMRCPFHDDSQASASIHHGKNAFKCHGCPMRGDAVKIISKVENITREEAIGQARSIFGASVESVSQPVHRSPKRRPLGNERWKDILG